MPSVECLSLHYKVYISKQRSMKIHVNRNSNVNLNHNSNFNQNAYGAISRALENRLKFQYQYAVDVGGSIDWGKHSDIR